MFCRTDRGTRLLAYRLLCSPPSGPRPGGTSGAGERDALITLPERPAPPVAAAEGFLEPWLRPRVGLANAASRAGNAPRCFPSAPRTPTSANGVDGGNRDHTEKRRNGDERRRGRDRPAQRA